MKKIKRGSDCSLGIITKLLVERNEELVVQFAGWPRNFSLLQIHTCSMVTGALSLSFYA
jgi:hypothetical protein